MTNEPTIIRIAPQWDNAESRLFCTRIQTIVAGVSESAFIHRGRNSLIRLTVLGTDVVIKLFHPKKNIGSILRWGSKAVKAFDNATKLVELGIGTPEPYAAVHFPDGTKAYVCAWVGNCQQVWSLNDHHIAEGDRIATDLGSFIACMHLAGALHRDNTPGNILLRPVENRFEFLVVDTNRMRFGPVGMWAGLGSLVQLECDDRLLEGYCWARSWSGNLANRLFKIRKKLHHCAWWFKNNTRPLRRKLGF